MLKDSNGQISMEYIILLGLVLVIILTIVGPLSTNVESDQAIASAKNGIINATNDLAYNNSGNIFKLDKLVFNNTTGSTVAYIYSMKQQSNDSPDTKYITSQTLKAMSLALNKPISGNKVLGKNYNYTLTIHWVS